MAKTLEVTTKELKGLLKHVINNNKFLQEQGKTPLAICVEGEAGIGKTSSIEQLASELNMQFVKLNLAQIEEISDLIGFPIRQFQLCKEEECLWIDEPAVQEFQHQGYKFTGNKRMAYCAPEWIAGKGENGILILDDFTRADQRFLQACMELIDRQSYISWKLPKGWTIILSTNPDDGNYQVTSMDDAQTTRFSTINLKFDIDCWAKYAEQAGVDGRCINFLLMTPELVKGKCNPRAITNFFGSISSLQNFEKSLPIISMMGQGSVGPEFSSMFTTFINNKLDKIIGPHEVLTNKSWDNVKSQLLDCIGKDNTYRADIASVLCTRLINYTVHYSKDNAIDDNIIKRVTELGTSDIFAMDLKYMLVKGIYNGNKTKFSRLILNPEIIKITVK